MQTRFDCPAEYAKHLAQNITVVTLDDCRKLRDWCLSIGQFPKMDDYREMLEFAVLLRHVMDMMG
jgi:hypothetical protein